MKKGRIAEVIQEMAEEKELHFGDIERAIGCPKGTIRQINTPHSKWLPKIAKYLYVEVTEILDTADAREALYQKIQQRARKLGMNISQLEARLGCPQDSIEHIRPSNIDFIKAIASELDVDPSTLLPEATDTKPTLKGSVAVVDVDKTVLALLKDLQRYYNPHSTFLPDWVDKPDLSGLDVVKSLVRELVGRVDKLPAMELKDPDSEEKIAELRTKLSDQAELIKPQHDNVIKLFRENSKLKDVSEVALVQKGNLKEIKEENDALQAQNSSLAEALKAAQEELDSKTEPVGHDLSATDVYNVMLLDSDDIAQNFEKGLLDKHDYHIFKTGIAFGVRTITERVRAAMVLKSFKD